MGLRGAAQVKWYCWQTRRTPPHTTAQNIYSPISLLPIPSHLPLTILSMQTTTSSLEQTLSFYAQLASQPHLLAQGYQLTKEYLLQHSTHRANTIAVLNHDTVPVIALSSNVLPEVMQDERVSAQEMHGIRQQILTMVYEQLTTQGRSKKYLMLMDLVHKIHHEQGYQPWLALYEQLLNQLHQQQHPLTPHFMIDILKPADDRIYPLAQRILPTTLHNSTQPELNLQIQYYCIKALSFLSDTDPDTSQNIVQPILPALIEYTVDNMRRSASAMKFALKVLTVVVGDFPTQWNSSHTKVITNCSVDIVGSYLMYVANGGSALSADLELMEDDEDEEVSMEVVTYQLMQLLLALLGNENSIDVGCSSLSAIAGSIITPLAYSQLERATDAYLMEVEDEGASTLRNKSIFFIGQLIENGKHAIKILLEYLSYALGQGVQKMGDFWGRHSINAPQLPSISLYIQSALFLLYSYTDQLLTDSSQLCVQLAGMLQSGQTGPLCGVIGILLLNKIVKKHSNAQQKQYLQFLFFASAKYSTHPGILIAIARGIYTYCPSEQLSLISPSLSNLLLQLKQYLLGTDSAQRQAGYLVIDFMLHIAKHSGDIGQVRALLPSEFQVHLLREYMHDGVTSSAVGQLVAKIADPATLGLIVGQIKQGRAKDQELSNILAKVIRSGAFSVSQSDILLICAVYQAKMDIVEQIVISFLQKAVNIGEQLKRLLNAKQNAKWAILLLKINCLQNPQSSFLRSVGTIIETASPHDVQKILALPYSLILKHPSQALLLLQQHSLFLLFADKVISYGRLFQGPHLKMVTGLVGVELALIDYGLVGRVRQMVSGWGEMEASEWEEQDEEDESFMGRMVGKLVNEGVEQLFQVVFGELCWDKANFTAQLSRLPQ